MAARRRIPYDACGELAICLQTAAEAVATLCAARSEEVTLRKAYQAAQAEATGADPLAYDMPL